MISVHSAGHCLPLDQSLLPSGARVLVAVSGGADSMALLWALRKAGQALVVGHVNHGLRGAKSDADQHFVVAHCAAHQIACEALRVEVKPTTGRGGEAQAREARYGALIKMAQKAGCAYVATGHTADDAFETVLLGLLRGATVAGYAAFPHARRLAPGLTVVRPLWEATRFETHRACTEAGWPWREDNSNQDGRFLRNRLRHEIVPLLGELVQGGVPRLARQAARSSLILADEFALLDSLAATKLREIYISCERQSLVLDGLALAALPVALQRRVLRLALRQMQSMGCNAPFEQIEAMRQAIAEGKRRCVWQWPHGLAVEWTGDMAGNRLCLRLVGSLGLKAL